MRTPTVENYLKAIYKLSENDDKEITTNAIAERVGIASSSVTVMLKRLSEKKLIEYTKYKGVILTEEGRRIAINIIRKHRIWEVFLVDKLQFGWDNVHNIAEELEHIYSEELIEKLYDFLGRPAFDPHGDPIPTSQGQFNHLKTFKLSEARLHSPVKMSGVIDHSPAFLQYLNKIGLSLGVEIEVEEITDFDKSMRICIGRTASIFISNEVGKNVLVAF
jgi:DtxR family Mn-dependent transcriptional regulator